MGYWDTVSATASQTTSPDDVTTPIAAASVYRPDSMAGIQMKDAQKILDTGYFKADSAESLWLQQQAAIWVATQGESEGNSWWDKTKGAAGWGLHALGVPLDYVQHGIGTGAYVDDKARRGDGWGPFMDFGELFKGENWSEGWDRSKINSPGQLMLSGSSGMTADELKEYGKTDSGRLRSGTIDLLINVFADPTVVAGKVSKAAKLAKVTVGAGKTSDVVKAAEAASKGDEALRALDVSKGAAKQGVKMDNLIRSTDGLNEAQITKLRPFAKSADASVIAALFADANRSIDDDVARWAAKREIMAAAMDDPAALERLAEKSANLTSKLAALKAKPELTSAPSALADETGQLSWDFFNSADKVDGVKAIPGLEDELGKLNRLAEIAGTVNTVGTPGMVDRGIQALRVKRAATERTFFDGRLGRTVTIVGGKAGVNVKAPHSINISDATSGMDDLSNALKNAGWVDRETRNGLLGKFAQASTREARRDVVAKAESVMLEGLAKRVAEDHPGVSIDNIRMLIAKGRDTRGIWRSGLGSSRLYSAANTGVHVVIGPDGSAVGYDKPILQSMIANTADFMDPKTAEKALRYATKTRAVDILNPENAAKVTRAGDIAESALDAYMNAWKFAALFRPAYLGRVQLDTQLRVLSALKPALWAMEATRGAVNTVKERGGVWADEPLRALFGSDSEGKRLGAKGILKERQAQGAQRSILKRPEEHLGASIQPARNNEELAIINRSFGNDVSDLLLDATDRNLQRLRGGGDWTVVNTDDLLWGVNWKRAVNRQIRNSPTAMAFVRGKSIEHIKRLAERQPDSDIAKEWALFRDSHVDVDQWLAKVEAHVDHYLPTDDIRSSVASRAINDGDVKAWFDNENSVNRMKVHGEGHSPTNAGSPLHKEYADLRRRWFETMGDKPETLWGKHPVYNKSFRDHMKTQLSTYSANRGGLSGTGVDRDAIVRKDLKQMAADRNIRGRGRMNKDELAQAIDAYDRTIPLDEINRMRRNAAKLAKRDVSDLLFDSTKMSNAGTTLKYLAPFFGAWEDTMKKWGAIFYDQPWLVERANQILPAPENSGLVYEDPKTGQKIIFIPGKLGKRLGISDEAGLRIDPKSANVIFQGDPWWMPPINGPIQSYALNKFAQSDPWFASQVEKSPILQYFLPYGVDNDNFIEQQLPGWARSLKSMASKDEDYAAAFNTIMQMEMVRYNRGEREDNPLDNPDDIQKRTRNWYWTRALLQANAPLSIKPGYSQQLQFYVDKAHQFRDSGDPEWMQHFYEMFPEYFPLTISLSANETGVVTSLNAQREVEKYPKALAADPSIGWALAGAENLGQEFDAGIYSYQQNKEVGDGSGKTFRGKKGAVEAARQVNVQKGWIDYHKVTMFLDETLKARGLTSYQQRGAEDLAEAKRQYRLALARDNHDWGAAYGERNDSSVASFVVSMQRAWSQYPKLAERSDQVALQKYLQARSFVGQALAQRGGNLKSEGNSDISAWWDQFTTQLRDSDVGFGQIWDRVLEDDDPSKSLMGVD